MSARHVVLTEREASMVLSNATVRRQQSDPRCAFCFVLGTAGCDDIDGTRREAFREAYKQDGSGFRLTFNVDALASCIRIAPRKKR